MIVDFHLETVYNCAVQDTGVCAGWHVGVITVHSVDQVADAPTFENSYEWFEVVRLVSMEFVHQRSVNGGVTHASYFAEDV